MCAFVCVCVGVGVCVHVCVCLTCLCSNCRRSSPTRESGRELKGTERGKALAEGGELRAEVEVGNVVGIRGLDEEAVAVDHKRGQGRKGVDHVIDREEVGVDHAIDREEVGVDHVIDREEVGVDHAIDREEVGVDHVIDLGRLGADQERDQGVKAKGSNVMMVLKCIQTCTYLHVCHW